MTDDKENESEEQQNPSKWDIDSITSQDSVPNTQSESANFLKTADDDPSLDATGQIAVKSNTF